MKLYWHRYNPWKDSIVYVPIEELAECVAEGYHMTKEEILKHWSQDGKKLDAYILPEPVFHSMGIRYGREGREYISPMGDQKKLAELLKRYS